jgi:preprotein translocase subunit SecD
MSNLKYRLGLIAVLVLASIWALFPRTVVERVKRDGVFVYDTLRRVPLKRGLDLQGGMHLSLEVDESKQAVADKSDALDRALTVIRTRIDEFGVAEPVIQKVGEDRIIVELPGIDDQQRAVEIVQDQAFLQFQIVDETQALEKALPRLDQIVRDKGAQVAGLTPADQPAAQKGLDLFTKDSTKQDSTRQDTTKADSAVIPGLMNGGPFRGCCSRDYPRRVSHRDRRCSGHDELSRDARGAGGAPSGKGRALEWRHAFRRWAGLPGALHRGGAPDHYR